MYEVLRRNLGYKVIALVVAILLWLWVSYLGTSKALAQEQTLNIPLVIRNQPNNMISMTKLPSVRVRLQSLNPSINVKDLYAYVDLTGAKPGENSYSIQMDPTPGIQVLDLSPQSVVLNLDTVQEKMIPVQLKIEGSPAAGFEAGTPILRPATINVRGAGMILETLDKVLVELSIAGAKESVVVTRPVLFRDKGGQLIFGPDPTMATLNPSPNSVEVIVPVTPKGLSSKAIPLRLVSEGAPSEGLILRSLVSVPSSVQVMGDPEDLKNLDFITLGPVNIDGLKEDKTFQISSDKLALPPGVTFASKVNFTVIAKIGPGMQEIVIPEVNVERRNVPEGLEVKPLPPIEVTVRALPEVLAKLTKDQIVVWIDATGLEAGEYPGTEVYWQLPPGVEMATPPKVDLVLTEVGTVETMAPQGRKTKSKSD